MDLTTLEKAQREYNNWKGVNRYIELEAKSAIDKFSQQESKPEVKKEVVHIDLNKEKLVEKVVKPTKVTTPKLKKHKLTEEQIWGMSKKEQTILLKSLGVTKVPMFEKDRVKKIMELQK